jgi:hypothetical protein
MELPDVLPIEMLPGRCRFGGLLDAKWLARIPLLGIDQGIDASGLQIDSNHIAGLQFGESRAGGGFWRSV